MIITVVVVLDFCCYEIKKRDVVEKQKGWIVHVVGVRHR